VGTDAAALAQVSVIRWFGTELLATSLLVFGILVLTDRRNPGRPQAGLTAVGIGLVLAALVAITAPVTMAALNPARDLGPRLFAAMAGWGSVALPGPRSGFWVPLVAPFAGGAIGAALYTRLYRAAFPPGTPTA
jgi:glycerol uptake facilitator protein